MTKTISPDGERRLHLDKRAEALVAAAPEGTDDDLLSTQQVAGWFGVTSGWLELGRAKGYGPPFVRLAPQIIRYTRGGCIKWLRQREYKSISDYVGQTSRLKRRAAEPTS